MPDFLDEDPEIAVYQIKLLTEITNSHYYRRIMCLLPRGLNVSSFSADFVHRAESVRAMYTYSLERISKAYRLAGKAIAEEEIYMSVLGASVRDRSRRAQLNQIKIECDELWYHVKQDMLQVDDGLSEEEADFQMLQRILVAFILSLRDLDKFGGCSFHLLMLSLLIRRIKARGLW